MVDFLKKSLEMEFDAAVGHVRDIVEEEGFSVMLVKPVHEILKKKLDVDFTKYTMILACGAPYAKGALEVSLDIGMLFPCSFVVYEDAGKTWVAHISIMKIAPAIGLATEEEMAPVIKMTSEAVHRAWDRF